VSGCILKNRGAGTVGTVFQAAQAFNAELVIKSDLHGFAIRYVQGFSET